MVKPTKEEIITAVADKENKRNRLLELFRKMNRVELLEFEDEEPKELSFNWNIFYEAMYEHDWPLKKDTFEEFQNARDTTVDKLKNQVEGMQKKLDRITKLLENAEFKLCGKDALKL